MSGGQNGLSGGKRRLSSDQILRKMSNLEQKIIFELLHAIRFPTLSNRTVVIKGLSGVKVSLSVTLGSSYSYTL